MKVSELIKKLQKFQTDFGVDTEVLVDINISYDEGVEEVFYQIDDMYDFDTEYDDNSAILYLKI